MSFFPSYSSGSFQSFDLSLHSLFSLTPSTSQRLRWIVGIARRASTWGALSTKRMYRDCLQGGTGAPILSPRALLRTGFSMVGR